MTSTQTASFVILITALVLILLLLIIGVPRLARLLFRHRLEIIRDECIDAILDDHLREAPSVRHFLRTVETATQISHYLTLSRLFALAWAMIDSGVDTKTAVTPPASYDDLHRAEREIMRQLDSRLCRAYASYLNWGSPASWPRRPFVALAGLIRPAGHIAMARKALPAVARETLQDTAARRSPARPIPVPHLADR